MAEIIFDWNQLERTEEREQARGLADLGLDLSKPPPTQLVSRRLASALLNQLNALR